MKIKPLSTAEWHKRFMQQSLWTTAIRNYLFKNESFRLDSRVLEIGCGTSAVLSQLPINDILLFGIDINREYLKFGQNMGKTLNLAQGDGHELPYPANNFDLIFFHYLLLWVEQPELILQEAARVGKTGSKIFLLAEPDYGGRVDAPPALEDLGKVQIESLLTQGADPFIGRKLPQIAKSAGLNILEFGILGSQSSLQIDQAYIESEWEMLKHDLSDQLTDSELHQYQTIDSQAWLEGLRVLFIPTFYLSAEIN